MGTLPKFRRLSIGNSGNNGYLGRSMDDETDDAKSNARKFRDYAAECRRLAQRASEKDGKVLIEIADAWEVCAQEAERKEDSASWTKQ
jgi:hypothetical protein